MNTEPTVKIASKVAKKYYDELVDRLLQTRSRVIESKETYETYYSTLTKHNLLNITFPPNIEDSLLKGMLLAYGKTANISAEELKTIGAIAQSYSFSQYIKSYKHAEDNNKNHTFFNSIDPNFQMIIDHLENDELKTDDLEEFYEACAWVNKLDQVEYCLRGDYHFLVPVDLLLLLADPYVGSVIINQMQTDNEIHLELEKISGDAWDILSCEVDGKIILKKLRGLLHTLKIKKMRAA